MQFHRKKLKMQNGLINVIKVGLHIGFKYYEERHGHD